MATINVKVRGTANLAQMQTAFAELQAQIVGVNTQLETMIALSKGIKTGGIAKMSQAASAGAAAQVAATEATEGLTAAQKAQAASTGKGVKVLNGLSAAQHAAAAQMADMETRQLRINKATDDYTKKLVNQKMSFRDLYRDRRIGQQAFREQLAMQQMQAKSLTPVDVRGKQIMTANYPKVTAEAGTAGQRVAWLNEQLKSGSKNLLNWGKNTQWAGRQLSVGFTMPIIAAGAAAGVFAYQMDKQFTRIQKVYDTTADSTSDRVSDMMAVEKELAQVREDGAATAMKAAKEYGVSAQDTLDVQAELAATGKKGEELQRSTAEVMRISRLGEIDHQDAINATIALQSIFRMSNEDLTESFNYMNAIENATSLATQDFAKAIPIAAGPVKAFGGDIKELGILLTAMKENGIDAAQGANALKATMQRLARPSKQIQEEFTALSGGFNITEIVDNADNLSDIFTQLYHITENMKDADKRKLFAGLFGSYQVTKMMALTKGMGELEQGIGQVSDAYEISNKSASDWADIADQEMKRYQNSISGRFETALKSLQIQLASLGAPFIVVATKVITAISAIIEKFNTLPGPIKTVIATAVGLAAIAGPVIMLVGLFANLASYAIRGAVGISTLMQTMKVMSAESKFAQLANDLATKGYQTQTNVINELTAAINRMNEANGISAVTAQENAAANAEATAVNSGKIGKGMKLAALSGGLFAASMTASMISSSGTVDNIAQMGMLAAIVLPAAQSLVPVLKSAALAAKGFAAASTAGAVAGLKTATATARTLGPMAALRAGGSAFAGSMAGVVNPIGLAAAGLAAGAFAMYKLHQSAEDARKEQELTLKVTQQAQADILGLTKKWADETGRAYKNYVAYNREGAKDYQNKKQQDYLEMVSNFEDEKTSVTLGDKTKEVKTVDYFNDQGAETQQYTLQNMAREALVNMGMNFDEAKQMIVAFLDATGKGFDEAELMAANALHNIGGTVKNLDWASIIEQGFTAIEESAGNPDLSNEIGKNLGTTIAMGLDQAKTVAERRDILSGLDTQVMSEWADKQKEITKFFQDNGGIYEAINDAMPMASKEFKDETAAKLADMIADPDAFRKAFLDQDIQGVLVELSKRARSDAEDGPLRNFIGEFLPATDEVENWERSMIGAFGKVFGFSDDVDTLKDALSQTRIELMGMSKDQATRDFLKSGGIIDQAKTAIDGLNAASRDNKKRGFIGDSLHTLDLGKRTSDVQKYLLDLKAYLENIDVSKLDADTKNWLLSLEGLYDIDFKGIGDDIDYVGDKADDAAGNRKITFTVEKEDALKLMNTAMQGVQQDIADAETDAFDKQMDAAIDARQKMWDARSEALDNREERENRQFENKWEKKKDAATKYWENREKAVDNAIKAEEKAEDQRKKMFDAEIARIERLNDAANRNIDFNVALSEGNFDEAAKIRNDSIADADQRALERASSAGETRSKRRTDMLEKRLDYIDKAREKHLKSLDKEEDAERRHLDKIQKMRQKALEEQTDADMAAVKEQWDYRKDSLAEQTDLFLSYIARNKKDLIRHGKEVGGVYKDLGDNTLKPMGREWSEFYQQTLYRHIRAATMEIKSDQMWAQMGKMTTSEMLKGMGFSGGMKQFRAFLKTGELPDDFGKPINKPKGVGPQQNTTWDQKPIMRHTGGWIDDATGSRKGVAKGTKGIHPSERLLLARKGEFVVNENSAQKHAGLLNEINAGKIDARRSNKGRGVGGQTGVAGMVAGTFQRMFASGVSSMVADSVSRMTQAAMAASVVSGSYGIGAAGMYSDRSFSEQQLKNAATIANVGAGMHMSARDIEIGIMTAITESGLMNLDYGDRDSLGLFQQRPSAGWGTPAQVTDPVYASRKFFEGLKGVAGRDAMAPWLAAQAVQRSAYSDGSNYRQYWDNAQAIFKNGLVETNGVYGAPSGGFKEGQGGWHRASVPGKGWINSHDYQNGKLSPLYAYADSRVTVSKATTSGGSPGNGRYHDPLTGKPYTSYGETIVLSGPGGEVRYAHLAPGKRFVQYGQHVKGGALIGLSGETGNATGPHTHFEVNGAEIAREWFAQQGIPLKKGGTIKRDGTPAVLHRDERVLTAPLTKKLDEGIDYIWEAAKHAGKKMKDAKKGKGESRYKIYSGPEGFAEAPDTWFTSMLVSAAKAANGVGANKKLKNLNDGGKTGLQMQNVEDSGKGATVRMGTLNTYVGTSAKSTISDVSRLMPMADLLTLTEVKGKFDALRHFLGDHGWGLHGGKSRDARGAVIAWNKDKLNGSHFGTRQLGKRQADILGGRELRYANYGLFEDKKSGRHMWQVAAHTVPTPGFDLRHRKLFFEQWGNIDKLVGELKGTGAPVFLSGDLNERKERPWFRNPKGLEGAQGISVDWIFHDKDMAKFLGKKVIGGMHTDHAGALLSQYNIPALAKGGNIRWDNTLANLHKDETVLTADLSAKLHSGIENLANGGGNVYHVNVTHTNPNANEEQIADLAVRKIKRLEARKPQSRSN